MHRVTLCKLKISKIVHTMPSRLIPSLLLIKKTGSCFDCDLQTSPAAAKFPCNDTDTAGMPYRELHGRQVCIYIFSLWYPREQSKWLFTIEGWNTGGVSCVSSQYFVIAATQEENDMQFLSPLYSASCLPVGPDMYFPTLLCKTSIRLRLKLKLNVKTKNQKPESLVCAAVLKPGQSSGCLQPHAARDESPETVNQQT